MIQVKDNTRLDVLVTPSLDFEAVDLCWGIRVPFDDVSFGESRSLTVIELDNDGAQERGKLPFLLVEAMVSSLLISCEIHCWRTYVKQTSLYPECPASDTLTGQDIHARRHTGCGTPFPAVLAFSLL